MGPPRPRAVLGLVPAASIENWTFSKTVSREKVESLADEPTGELDFHTGVRMLRLLREHVQPECAALVVTHNREIARIADRVLELSSGRIVGDAPPKDGKVDVSQLHW